MNILLFHLLFIISFSFSFLNAEIKGNSPIETSETAELTRAIERVLLPQEHPLQKILERILVGPSMFNDTQSLEQSGFAMEWNLPAVNTQTILVASHPAIKGYLIKKYRGSPESSNTLQRYLTRIHGAEKIAKYIEKQGCKHLVVPKKWLYRLPSSFNNPINGLEDYLLIVEKIDICEGGWWGGETLEKYREINLGVLRELCFALHDLKGCDAWPQNQPFTRTGKIAFIDTEHLGRCYGDFLDRTIKFINPALVNYALLLWNKRAKDNHN